MSDRPAAAPAFEPLAAAMLLALTLLAVPGLRGILDAQHSLAAALLAGAVMHAVPGACRHLKVRGEIAFSGVALVLLVAWLCLRDTTVLGLPTPGTLTTAAERLRLALGALHSQTDLDAVEPGSAVEGRLLLTVVLVGGCALIAHLAAFRVGRPFLALLPSFLLILAGAVLAPTAAGPPALALYLATALAFVLVQHAAERRASVPAMAGRPPLRLTALLPAGAAVAGAAVAIALLLAPHLPGYGQPALARSGRVDDGTVTLKPLVDVKPSLTKRSERELFAVNSAMAAYWRLASLDTFDGRVWSSSCKPEGCGPAGYATDLSLESVPYGSGVPVLQEFEIGALRSVALPAAYRPQSVDGPVELRPDSLSVRATVPVSAGTRYGVFSILPRSSDIELLQARPVGGPALEPYLALPAGLDPRVKAEARRVTSRLTNGPYEGALALQAYFRNGFTYNLDVKPGHGEDALVRFLFTTKEGYCEQFAAAFAVMARAVGLPARVAVGFTPGELEADGRYHVRGLNAHAWPEVFLEGAGWVSFEPTPGRGMPGAESYTGLQPEQAHPAPRPPDVGGSTPAPTPTPTPAPTPGPTSPGGGTTVPTGAGTVTPPTTTIPSVPAPDPNGRGPSSRPALAWSVAAGAGVAAAAAAIGLPLLHVGRRRSRRAGAQGDNERVLVAWAEAEEALAALGLGRRPAETLLAHAHRAVSDGRLPTSLAEPVLLLADRAGTAGYSGAPVEATEAAWAAGAAAAVRSGLRRVTPLPRRIGRYLDPRPLMTSRGHARRLKSAGR